MGFIKLDRKILDWEWYQDINVRILFIHCLLLANWKDTRYKGEVIPRGSFVASLPILSEGTGLSIRQARTALDKLKMTGELTVRKHSKYTVFTVSNYCKYQDSDSQDDRQVTGNRQSNDSQMTGTIYKEEYKNLRSEEDIDCSADVRSETNLKPTADEAESLFEELWKAYPQKRGKGSISKTTKAKLLKVGREQMLRAIDRYVGECKEQGRYYKNGSTFFNSGYLDYLDDTYTPLSESPQKGNALNGLMREQKVKKVESMKGQNRGTDYDAMIAQSVISGYTDRSRDFTRRNMGGLMEE